MTDIVEKMALAMRGVRFKGYGEAPTYRSMAEAALAVARPLILEEAADIVDRQCLRSDIQPSDPRYLDAIAAAIREKK